MSHVYHEGPDDAVLYDGCDECEKRSKSIEGLLGLDSTNLRILVDRMIGVELSSDRDHYRTRAESRAGRILYYVYVLVERLSDRREALSFFGRLTVDGPIDRDGGGIR